MNSGGRRAERLRRELAERGAELSRAPLGAAGLAGAGLAVSGALLRRPREGALAALAAAAVVGHSRAHAALAERASRNVEDLAALAPRLGPQASLLGDWAVDADFGRLALKEATQRPGLVVELGSGLSTQMLESALEEAGRGRLISVDHEPYFAERTAARLRTDRASVVVAPLRRQSFSGAQAEWYDAAVLLESLPPDPIDLLVVDGPPSIEAGTRWPAVDVLGPRLAPNALVLLDDGRRPHERACALRWVSRHPDLALSWHDTLKGAWRLERREVPSESPLRTAGRRALWRLNPNPTGFGRVPVRR